MIHNCLGFVEKMELAKLVGAANANQQKKPSLAPRRAHCVALTGAAGGQWLARIAMPQAMITAQMNAIRYITGMLALAVSARICSSVRPCRATHFFENKKGEYQRPPSRKMTSPA